MLSLSRGGPTIWLSPRDAVAIGVADNDWMECVNANGVLVGRAIVSHRMPKASFTSTTLRSGSSTCRSPKRLAAAVGSTTR